LFTSGAMAASLLLLSSGNLFAQSKTGVSPWTLYKTVANIEFYHQVAECDGKKIVLLKFNNKTQQKVTIQWKDSFEMNPGEPNMLHQTSAVKSIVLLPGTTSATDCNNTKQKALLSQPPQLSPIYKAEPFKFSFSEIKIK
jgi:hypothetical protein